MYIYGTMYTTYNSRGPKKALYIYTMYTIYVRYMALCTVHISEELAPKKALCTLYIHYIRHYVQYIQVKSAKEGTIYIYTVHTIYVYYI